ENSFRRRRHRLAGAAHAHAAGASRPQGRERRPRRGQRRKLRGRVRHHAGDRPRVPGRGRRRDHHRQPRVGQEGDPSAAQDRAAAASPPQLPAGQPGPGLRHRGFQRRARGGAQPAGAHLHVAHRRSLSRRRRAAGGTEGTGRRGRGRVPCGGDQRKAGVRPLPGRPRGRRGGHPHPRADGRRAHPPQGHGAHHRPGDDRGDGRHHRDEVGAFRRTPADPYPWRAAAAGGRRADAAGRRGGRGPQHRACEVHRAGERSLRARAPGRIQKEI
ncbi:MAG: Uncharacterized protein YmdB, partial [uncultured Gemmatimonadetes bacterium]